MPFMLKVFLSAASVAAAAVALFAIVKSILKIGPYASKEYEIKVSSFSGWEEVLAHPGEIRLETLLAGEVGGTLSGMINLKDRSTPPMENVKIKAPLLAHLIYHRDFGTFLIDTGFDSSYSERPWGHFKGLLKHALKYSVERGHGIEELLKEKRIELQGVFCTHFHEHQGGAPSLPHHIPFFFGKGERDMDMFPFVYSKFLEGKIETQAIDFDRAKDMSPVGKSVDIFGDGSFWAISTPGHTKGHISYLINGHEGKYMLMGDICMCRKSFELGLESGSFYSENPSENKKSFLKIKKLMDTYPEIKPVFGHESEHFPIKYQHHIRKGNPAG